ncbi:ABC transporter ATP-binding protein [Microvirga arabica]|uniref:ABC transporter ATP-binding protein n=1 Tax=Microvirga arabica TaxID=1128671 RepID=UPI0019397203|nr:ABC transporter ATP-binding protein [Microvirga arabica]MBM1171499.1 ABC transporter ATP-binding protein [Microvirga arabica]
MHPAVNREVILDIRGLEMEGFSGGSWHKIVHGLDLTLQRGEVLGLIGESGAGKSTVGLAAMGYARSGCRVTGGTVLFKGQDLLRMPAAERRRLRGLKIAYVAQSAAASFNPARRLMDQVIEVAVTRGGRSRDEAVRDAQDLFHRLALPNPETIGFRYPHEVSGGQLQRVMTAMAMACRPDIIIFDEPTTALDVTTQVEVLAAIRRIVEEFQTAAIYITHDLAVVAQLAHRIMVLRHGRLIEEAPTRVMLAHPQHEYTRSLWAVRKLAKDPEPRGDELLKVRGLLAHYGTVPVLEDVTVEVERGRTVAVVGESGSGKSTLARVITGLLKPASGEITFFGEQLPRAVKDRSKEQLRRLQMIHQSPDASLNPRHTVREVIGRPLEFYFGLSGQRREQRIVQLLDMIELSSKYLDRLPSALSGGQKQRVCIARALAANPELIICDEVTSALDQLVQEEILKLLLRLQGELSLSYLFITHDIATVKAIADRVVVMHKGRVVQQGTKAEVLTPPHPAYTKLLLSSVPDVDPDWLNRLLAARQPAVSSVAS